jgi:pimeloyl-ACP methyl ester carboxylesterase
MTPPYDNTAEESEHGSASSGAVELHYETRGRGPAVLLVMGFGMSLSAWWRTVPVLARHFRVIALDNRGIGRSGASPWPYFAGRMADDAVAVLDSAGEERAHVYGISLGGMVAQEIALRHPDRVDALVLGATTAGGAGAAHGAFTAMSFFSRARTMDEEEAHWAAVPYMYGEQTRRRYAGRIGEDIARRLEPAAASLTTHVQQLAAAGTHRTEHRLDEITAPTLVVHGAEDVVVPVENGHALAAGIPNAELRVWPRAGHFYPTDEPRADRDVARFLRVNTGGRPAPLRLLARTQRLAARVARR